MPKTKKTESEIADWGNFKMIIEEAQHRCISIIAPNGKSYNVKEVSSDPKKIFFCVDGICDEKKYYQGMDGYLFFMNHFLEYEGNYPASVYKKKNPKSIDKMYFIAAFHPRLSWSEDLSHILFK